MRFRVGDEIRVGEATIVFLPRFEFSIRAPRHIIIRRQRRR